MVLQCNVAHSGALVCALVAPNFEMAFTLQCGYFTIAGLAGGFMVNYPNLSPMTKWMQWISYLKYPFQVSL